MSCLGVSKIDFYSKVLYVGRENVLEENGALVDLNTRPTCDENSPFLDKNYSGRLIGCLYSNAACSLGRSFFERGVEKQNHENSYLSNNFHLLDRTQLSSALRDKLAYTILHTYESMALGCQVSEVIEAKAQHGKPGIDDDNEVKFSCAHPCLTPNLRDNSFLLLVSELAKRDDEGKISSRAERRLRQLMGTVGLSRNNLEEGSEEEKRFQYFEYVISETSKILGSFTKGMVEEEKKSISVKYFSLLPGSKTCFSIDEINCQIKNLLDTTEGLGKAKKHLLELRVFLFRAFSSGTEFVGVKSVGTELNLVSFVDSLFNLKKVEEYLELVFNELKGSCTTDELRLLFENLKVFSTVIDDLISETEQSKVYEIERFLEDSGLKAHGLIDEKCLIFHEMNLTFELPLVINFEIDACFEDTTSYGCLRLKLVRLINEVLCNSKSAQDAYLEYIAYKDNNIDSLLETLDIHSSRLEELKDNFNRLSVVLDDIDDNLTPTQKLLALRQIVKTTEEIYRGIVEISIAKEFSLARKLGAQIQERLEVEFLKGASDSFLSVYERKVHLRSSNCNASLISSAYSNLSKVLLCLAKVKFYLDKCCGDVDADSALIGAFNGVVNGFVEPQFLSEMIVDQEKSIKVYYRIWEWVTSRGISSKEAFEISENIQSLDELFKYVFEHILITFPEDKCLKMAVINCLSVPPEKLDADQSKNTDVFFRDMRRGTPIAQAYRLVYNSVWSWVKSNDFDVSSFTSSKYYGLLKELNKDLLSRYKMSAYTLFVKGALSFSPNLSHNLAPFILDVVKEKSPLVIRFKQATNKEELIDLLSSILEFAKTQVDYNERSDEQGTGFCNLFAEEEEADTEVRAESPSLETSLVEFGITVDDCMECYDFLKEEYNLEEVEISDFLEGLNFLKLQEMFNLFLDDGYDPVEIKEELTFLLSESIEGNWQSITQIFKASGELGFPSNQEAFSFYAENHHYLENSAKKIIIEKYKEGSLGSHFNSEMVAIKDDRKMTLKNLIGLAKKTFSNSEDVNILCSEILESLRDRFLKGFVDQLTSVLSESEKRCLLESCDLDEVLEKFHLVCVKNYNPVRNVFNELFKDSEGLIAEILEEGRRENFIPPLIEEYFEEGFKEEEMRSAAMQDLPSFKEGKASCFYDEGMELRSILNPGQISGLDSDNFLEVCDAIVDIYNSYYLFAYMTPKVLEKLFPSSFDIGNLEIDFNDLEFSKLIDKYIAPILEDFSAERFLSTSELTDLRQLQQVSSLKEMKESKELFIETITQIYNYKVNANVTLEMFTEFFGVDRVVELLSRISSYKKGRLTNLGLSIAGKLMGVLRENHHLGILLSEGEREEDPLTCIEKEKIDMLACFKSIVMPTQGFFEKELSVTKNIQAALRVVRSGAEREIGNLERELFDKGFGRTPYKSKEGIIDGLLDRGRVVLIINSAPLIVRNAEFINKTLLRVVVTPTKEGFIVHETQPSGYNGSKALLKGLERTRRRVHFKSEEQLVLKDFKI
jgi:hypothetical protein